MPIFEYVCVDCALVSEHLVLNDQEKVSCPGCGGHGLKKLLSPTSSASGPKNDKRLPGSSDTACCGSRPGTQGCVPGSCCGKA